MNIFFLMNGNIFNYSLASEQCSWSCGWGCSHTAYAIPPAPPGNISTTGEPIFVQSYINAYNTAFNQSNPAINQKALKNYHAFTSDEVDTNFVPGTFGYAEQYNNLQSNTFFTIYSLQDNPNVYTGNPYLFISAGSGGGSGFMYLDWVIVTYGIPYVASIS
jgi:hypothetical protein